MRLLIEGVVRRREFVSISYGAFGSLRLSSAPLRFGAEEVSISYGAFGSLRPPRTPLDPRGLITFQSPTEHSVHCDDIRARQGEILISTFQSPTEHSVHCDGDHRLVEVQQKSFNLLRSIRFIATADAHTCPRANIRWFQSPTEHSVHCDEDVLQDLELPPKAFQSPTEHSVHCDE